VKHATSIFPALVLTTPAASLAVVAAIAVGFVTAGGAQAEPVKPAPAKKGCTITLQGPGAGQSIVYDDGYSFTIVDKATGKTHTFKCNDGVWTETVSKVSAPSGTGKPVLIKTAVMVRGTEEQVSKACDEIKGVPTSGHSSGGYGCYNPKTDVMVACDTSAACIVFSPLTTHAKTLRGLLGLGRGEVSPNTEGSGKGGSAPPPSSTPPPPPPPPSD
jgi:hypothetical protein